MRSVRVVHPLAGEAYAPEQAVAHWRSRGWELAGTPQDDVPAIPPDPHAKPQVDKQETRAARRRSEGES